MPEQPDSEPFREFTREIILRMDRSVQEFAERQRVIFEDVRASREESRRYFEALDAKLDTQREELRDVHAESRAQTQALLRMIDRLDGGAAA